MRLTGRPVVVDVHGASGVGKTAVVERFLQDLRDGGGVVALAGRCYEQSSVPYKALDGLVDDLLRYLRRLPRERVEAVLPARVADLARLFPVLRRLEAVVELPLPAAPDDPHEARRRGFGALRELCNRLAARGQLVLFADDLQWGDAESAALLEELVRPPDAPPLLFVAGYRRRDADTSPFVAALRRLPVERRELAVDPLTEDDARALAEALLGSAPEAKRAAAEIARESAGSPLLVQELVEYHLGQPDSTAPLSIDAVIRARVARLADEPRRLAEVVALAVGPVAVESALRAADVPADQQAAALDVLVTGRTVRTAGGGDAPRTVEPFHDRVRATIAGDLTADVRAARHRRLAVVLAAADRTDAEALAHHFEEAGEPGQAADYYAAAGGSRRRRWPGRAADQFRRALDLGDPGDPRRKDLTVARAAALAGATHGVEAAAVYAEAAALCGGAEAMVCRQRAAEQLIWAGRVSEGVKQLRGVLTAAGVAIPPTDRALRRSLVWLRVRVWLRGYRFRPRPADRIPPAVRLRVEICRWAAGQVRLSDTQLGSWLHSYGLLLSLRSGDPGGAAIGLGREAMIRPLTGRHTAVRIESLLRRAREALAAIPDPATRDLTNAILGLHRVIGFLFIGDFRAAVAAVPPAAAALRACTGAQVVYERLLLRVFDILAWLMLGNLNRSREFYAEIARELTERGNLHAEVTFPLITWAHLLDLADDDTAAARARIRTAIARWGSNPGHVQHVLAWRNEADVWLYEGRAAEAWAFCREHRPVADRFALMEDFTDSMVHWTWARAAVAAAAAGEDRERALAEATRAAVALDRYRDPHPGPALGSMVRAAVADLRGDRPTAGHCWRERRGSSTAGGSPSTPRPPATAAAVSKAGADGDARRRGARRPPGGRRSEPGPLRRHARSGIPRLTNGRTQASRRPRTAGGRRSRSAPATPSSNTPRTATFPPDVS